MSNDPMGVKDKELFEVRNRLDDRLSVLANSLDSAESRLEPILSPMGPEGKTATTPTPPRLTKYGADLSTLIDRLDHQISRIRNLLDRLEI